MITVLLSISPSPANVQARMRVGWTDQAVQTLLEPTPSPHARGLDAMTPDLEIIPRPKPACAWAGRIVIDSVNMTTPQARMRVGWTVGH